MIQWIANKFNRSSLIREYGRVIDEMKTGALLNQKLRRYEAQQIYNHVTTLRILEQFKTEKGSTSLSRLDAAWVQALTLFLVSRGLAKNSIAGNLTRIKTVLNILGERGMIKNIPPIVPKWEHLPKVFNDICELEQMAQATLPDSLNTVRDMFVIQSFIGLRFRDLRRLIKDQSLFTIAVGGRTFIRMVTSKTKKEVVIPVNSLVRQLLQRMADHGSTVPSIQHYNISIKQVAMLANIVAPVPTYKTRNGEFVETIRLKHQLITSHTARRNFATNAFLANVPTLNIMAITGHTTEQSFMRYICADALNSAISIADHPFFRDLSAQVPDSEWTLIPAFQTF